MNKFDTLIRKANAYDVLHMAENMREIDKYECFAQAFMQPLEALTFSLNVSREVYAVIRTDTGYPIAMYGVGKRGIMDTETSVWLLCTDDIKDVKLRLMKSTLKRITEMETDTTLYNYVAEKNTRTLRWLKSIGFTIMDAKPYGVLGHNFHKVFLKV